MKPLNYKIHTIIICTLMTLSFSASAQTIRSSYFLESIVMRHKLNPAFSSPKGYFSIPLLGNINAEVQSNIGLKNFLYPTNNNRSLTTFMDPNVSASKFLGGLSNSSKTQANFDLSILSTGFYAWNGFNTIDVSVKGDVGASIPKSLFEMMKLGMDNPNGNSYKIKELTATTTEFAEIAFGHSHAINSRLTIGAKFKVLVGLADVQANIKQMDVTMSEDVWQVSANGTLKGALKGASFITDNNGEVSDIKYDNPGVAGWGAGIDLGATYKLLDNLTLSAALTDIGFIRWNKALLGATKNEPYIFDGFQNIDFDDANSSDYIDNQFESLADDLKDLARFYDDGTTSYSRALRSTLRVGGEYGILNNKISFGLLSSTRFGGTKIWTEAMGSVNFRPLRWFQAAITGSVSNFGSSYGWLINFCPGGMNLFIGTDYMIGRITPQGVPIGNANVNVNFGLSVPIGKRRPIEHYTLKYRY